MTNAEKNRLICNATELSGSLCRTLGKDITLMSYENIKTGQSIFSKKLASLCEKHGRLFFFSPEGDILCALPVFCGEKAVLFCITGSLCSISPSLAGTKIWDISEILTASLKGLSLDYGKKSYPDTFKKILKIMLMSVRLKNSTEFRSEINNRFCALSAGFKEDTASFKAIVLTFFLLCTQVLCNNGINIKNVFGKNLELFSELKNAESIPFVKNLLLSALENTALAFFGKASPKHIAAEDAVKYIRRFYSEKLTLESVAHEVFMSPHYLSKAFYEEIGVNFNTFLNSVRVENAKILLKDEKNELAQISNAVGFHDQSYFTKVFKKFTGLSPKEYRLKMHLTE